MKKELIQQYIVDMQNDFASEAVKENDAAETEEKKCAGRLENTHMPDGQMPFWMPHCCL